MTSRARTTLVAGVAAVTLIAAPAAYAQGKGNGGNNGQGNSAQSNGNGNKGNSKRAGSNDRGRNASVGRKNGNAKNSRTDNRRNDNAQRNNGNSNRVANVRGNGRDNGNGDAVRQTGNRGNGYRADGFDVRSGKSRGNDRQSIRIRSRDGIDLNVGFALPELRRTLLRDTRIIDGCPPGLAKKRNGCLPPGQAKRTYRSYDPGFFGLSGIRSGRYFYDDGYLLNYRGNNLAGYLPLLGGALGIGNIWPADYRPSPLPDYYGSYYDLGEPRGYRFADNVIYRVDPETAAIRSIAALLTGDDISVGQPLPAGYDIYNVPNRYRDRYRDRSDARYRYVDGYIYEVDPETALVRAVIDLVN